MTFLDNSDLKEDTDLMSESSCPDMYVSIFTICFLLGLSELSIVFLIDLSLLNLALSYS